MASVVGPAEEQERKVSIDKEVIKMKNWLLRCLEDGVVFRENFNIPFPQFLRMIHSLARKYFNGEGKRYLNLFTKCSGEKLERNKETIKFLKTKIREGSVIYRQRGVSDDKIELSLVFLQALEKDIEKEELHRRGKKLRPSLLKRLLGLFLK